MLHCIQLYYIKIFLIILKKLNNWTTFLRISEFFLIKNIEIPLISITEKYQLEMIFPASSCEMLVWAFLFMVMHILETDKEQSCHDRESVKADPFLTLHVACLEMLTTVLCEAQLSLDIIRHLWRNRYKRKRWDHCYFISPSGRKRLSYFAVEPQAAQRGGRIAQPSLSQTAASSATRCILVGRGWKLLPALLNVPESVISSALMHVSCLTFHYPFLYRCVYINEKLLPNLNETSCC